MPEPFPNRFDARRFYLFEWTLPVLGSYDPANEMTVSGARWIPTDVNGIGACGID